MGYLFVVAFDRCCNLPSVLTPHVIHDSSPPNADAPLPLPPPPPRSVHQALWRWRNGSRPVSTEYYVTPDYGIDTNSSLALAGLVVFTDARVESVPGTGGLYMDERFNGSLRR